MSDRRFTFVVNPASGRGRMAKLLPRLTAAVYESGLDAEIRVSSSPDDPAAIAAEAFDAGRSVVACGGDGLVGVLAGVTADRVAAGDSSAVLGVVPCGSGNDFARAIGLDHKDPFAALGVLAGGSVRRVDLARVDGRWYGCVASAGFDAEANEWANTVRRLKGTALYVAAALRTLARYRPRGFRVTVDGVATEVEAWLVAVGNGPSYGGGMNVTPSARLDDGLLDVTVVGPVSRVAFLRTFPKVFSGTHVEHPQVTTMRGSEVLLEPLGHDPMPLYADGEDAGVLPAHITAVPGALPVIRP